MKKILIIITTGVVEYGGLFTVMKNYLYNMDRRDFAISIVSCNDISSNLEREFKEQNIEYYKLDSRQKKPFRYIIGLFRLFKREKYSIVHINGNSSTMAIETVISRLSGIPNRIVHGHNTKGRFPVINKILSPLFHCTYTLPIAVSNESGIWLYGKRKFMILKNAIKVSHFCFNSAVRNEYRERLHIEDFIVIGTIGKLNKQKNHIFLVDLLRKLLSDSDKYMLLLVGEGDERRSIQRRAAELHVQDHIIMLGARVDNAELLQAMDIFVFPSLFEGFGLAFLEAQATGMPCVCSDNIPEEAQICEDIDVLALQLDRWLGSIRRIEHTLEDRDRMLKSKQAMTAISKRGFNIDQEASKLREIYESL